MDLSKVMKLIPFLRKKILPFGTKTEMVEILKEVTVTTEEDDDYAEMPDSLIFFEEEPVENEEYTVIFNGEEYKCKAMKSMGVYDLGNQSIWGEDYENTGEPFLVEFHDGVFWLYTFNGGSFTLSIKGPVLKPVDEFTVLGKKKIVYVTYDSDENLVCSKYIDELMELVDKGYSIYLKDTTMQSPPIPAIHQNYPQFTFVGPYPDGFETGKLAATVYYIGENSAESKSVNVHFVLD